MFTHSFTLKMKHTDMAGVAFFASYYVMAHDVYELALESVGEPLPPWIHLAPMPLARSEAHYHAPMRLGDEVCVCFGVKHISKRSFELAYEFWVKPLMPLTWESSPAEPPSPLPEGERVWQRAATLSTVHVAIDPKRGKSVALPERFKLALERLGPITEGAHPSQLTS